MTTTQLDRTKPLLGANLIGLPATAPYDFVVLYSGEPKGFVTEHYDGGTGVRYFVHTLDGEPDGYEYVMFSQAVSAALDLPAEVFTVHLSNLTTDIRRMAEATGLRDAARQVVKATRLSEQGFVDARANIGDTPVAYISPLGEVRLVFEGLPGAVTVIEEGRVHA